MQRYSQGVPGAAAGIVEDHGPKAREPGFHTHIPASSSQWTRPRCPRQDWRKGVRVRRMGSRDAGHRLCGSGSASRPARSNTKAVAWPVEEDEQNAAGKDGGDNGNRATLSRSLSVSEREQAGGTNEEEQRSTVPGHQNPWSGKMRRPNWKRSGAQRGSERQTDPLGRAAVRR